MNNGEIRECRGGALPTQTRFETHLPSAYGNAPPLHSLIFRQTGSFRSPTYRLLMAMLPVCVFKGERGGFRYRKALRTGDNIPADRFC